MKKENLDKLGFKKISEEKENERLEKKLNTKLDDKESKGFVAGVGVAPAAGFKSSKTSWSALFGWN